MPLHWKCLQGFTGWLRVFSAISAGKTLSYLQIAGKSLQILEIFPAHIAEKPLNHPVNPCKHLQCTMFCSALGFHFVFTLLVRRRDGRAFNCWFLYKLIWEPQHKNWSLKKIYYDNCWNSYNQFIYSVVKLNEKLCFVSGNICSV